MNANSLNGGLGAEWAGEVSWGPWGPGGMEPTKPSGFCARRGQQNPTKLPSPTHPTGRRLTSSHSSFQFLFAALVRLAAQCIEYILLYTIRSFLSILYVNIPPHDPSARARPRYTRSPSPGTPAGDRREGEWATANTTHQ